MRFFYFNFKSNNLYLCHYFWSQSRLWTDRVSLYAWLPSCSFVTNLPQCEAEFLSDGRVMVKTKLVGRYIVEVSPAALYLGWAILTGPRFASVERPPNGEVI